MAKWQKLTSVHEQNGKLTKCDFTCYNSDFMTSPLAEYEQYCFNAFNEHISGLPLPSRGYKFKFLIQHCF